MQIWIGTSGYSYPDWVGGFYPPGTRTGKLLGHYCQYFPLVELNFTFYRLPTAAMLARLADQTPEGFQFVVKLPRTLSHEQNASDIAAFRHAVGEMQSRHRLLGLLCQFPQAYHDVPERRAWLNTLAQEFGDHRLAVEFRHVSWFRPEVPAWLAERKVDLVSVDVPDLPSLYPRGLVQSSPRIYVRFHSRKAKNWYRGDTYRYDYHYPDETLVEWIEVLRQNEHPSDQVLLLFNNCKRGHSAVNAQRVRELLSERATEMDIVEPFASSQPESQQRFLFD